MVHGRKGLWSDAVVAYVHEYLFAVGCAQFLAGRLRLPRDGHGLSHTGTGVALPVAPLLCNYLGGYSQI